MNKTDQMNLYLADLAVMNIKLHNLHWHVVGVNFFAIHNFTESLYDDFFSKFDDVAEQLKIKGVTPLTRLKDYLEITSIEELEPKNFSTKEVLNILLDDLNHFKKQALSIRQLAIEEDDFSTANMFEEHITGFEKNLWFLSSMNK
ncbi:Dps family protein [Fusibacter ferrireducens]|uniref:DNA starvation/stationary phase protection protein n=1 Tax=Fusibacter ferrireducens TaxID=2785058 RepID=A0ABR9ZZU2_9FIRM|nr:DNA starvation/stationary phase protection protein [Fusibacter ferrireducens]MBF4695965.1 DNA starvation/stationary phase protection protein [Fusibacter ferrireducens]